MGNIKRIVLVGALVFLVAVGGLMYSVLRTPAEAGAPITAIPLGSSAGTSSAASTAPSATTAEVATAAATAAATAEAATSSAADAGAAGSTSSPILAQLVQDESEARFVIDEVLNNAPKTVIGTTNQVAGEISVDPQDPTKTQVGVIQVNARTLTTDSNFRNRAIKNQILSTDQYEFVTFTPTELVGLPQSGSIGQTYTFQIKGDLTIRDVTKPVTFAVTVTPQSETRLEGSASTTIRYADWNITIPSVPQVASVSDQVRLEIDFVAVPKS